MNRMHHLPTAPVYLRVSDPIMRQLSDTVGRVTCGTVGGRRI